MSHCATPDFHGRMPFTRLAAFRSHYEFLWYGICEAPTPPPFPLETKGLPRQKTVLETQN